MNKNLIIIICLIEQYIMITHAFLIDWLTSILTNDLNWLTIQKALTNNVNFDKYYLEPTYNKVKGDIFEYFAKYILMAQGYKTYLYYELTDELKDKLFLPATDKGIDLIINKGNEWIGVQVKWRSEEKKSIDRTLVASFVYSIDEANLDYGILFSNVNKITFGFSKSNIKWHLNKELTKVINSKLVKTMIDDLSKIKDIIKPIAKSIVLRDYQNNAVNILLNDKTSRKQCIMPCGTGKTIVMLDYLTKKDISNKKVVILFPSLQLVNQTYELLTTQLNKANIMCICSQLDSINLTCGENNNNEEAIKLYEEYLASDYNHVFTTDITIIKRRLKAKSIIVLSTYHSCKLLDKMEFDIGLFDEAHKTVNSPVFSVMLHDKNNKIKERIFFTATPRYYKGINIDCISMDNKEIYGDQAYNYTFKQAIEDKYILDFKLILYVAPKGYEELVNEKYIKKDNINIKSYYVIAAIQLAQHIQNTNGCNKILTYHNTVENANNFKKLLEYIFGKYKLKANIFNMSGNTKLSKRSQILNEFCNNIETSIICSAKVLNEGVDLPCVDTIMLIDPKNSITDIIQSIGRAMRLYKDMKECNVIIPIMFDNIENKHEFSQVVRVLASMKDLDDNIVDYFVSKEENNKIIVKNMNIANISVNNNVVLFDIKDIEKKLETKILASNYFNFDYNKQKLFEFCDEYGKIPRCIDTYENINIGRWFETQKYKINNINSKIYKMLIKNDIVKIELNRYLNDKLNNPIKEILTFNQWKGLLINFCDDFKRAPITKDKYKDYNIGIWLKNKKCSINDHNSQIYIELSKIELVKPILDEYLKLKINRPVKIKYTFNQTKQLLCFFCKEHNRIPSKSEKYNNYNIGKWLQNQKHKIDDNNSKLYIALSDIPLVKTDMDRYIKEKIENQTNKHNILNFDQFKTLLFEFCDKFERTPIKNEVYKEYNINSWLANQQKKVINTNSEIYIKLSENKLVKEKLDALLEKRQHTLCK